MEIREIQRLSAEVVDKIDKELNLDRNVQLNLSQLVEELGELARAANLERLRNKKPDLKDLEEEFADVFLQLAKLADFFGVDLEKSVLDKIEILKKRHNI